MKYLRIAKIIIWSNLSFFMIYNTYFHWNFTAKTIEEKWCDLIYGGVNALALIIFFIPLIKMYVKSVEVFENGIDNLTFKVKNIFIKK